jgi:hypothetical protein
MSEQWIPHQRETWPWRVGTLKRDIQFSFFNGWGGIIQNLPRASIQRAPSLRLSWSHGLVMSG